MRTVLNTFLISMAVALLAACTKPTTGQTPEYSEQAPAATQKAEYIFLPLPISNPVRLFEVFGPLVDVINAQATDFVVKMESSQNYVDFEHKIANRRVHFTLVNPYQTMRSETHGYKIFGKMGDDDHFRGFVVVRKDSGIKEVSDLRGAAISIPAQTAVAACMMPKLFFKEHGLDVETEADVRYVGSQESTLANVVQGMTKAACVWQPAWDGFVQDQPKLAAQLEVKWKTDPLINNGFVVRDDVPEAHLRVVREAIFALHTHAAGREILGRMKLSRFEPATSATFEPIREFLKKYEQAFGRPPIPQGEL
jgi:phosphonate transport system substrate-binding protein